MTKKAPASKVDAAYGAPGERFPQPPPGHRDWYAYEALRSLPRLLTLIDRNPFSETYGCFDREFWHYRTVDFPCGMSQEMCLPLALAYAHPFPHNPYYKNERLRALVEASISFARRSSHADGSCDDYFPYERALGALVFSTYAMTESCLQLGLERKEFTDFFRLRGDWLRNHNETGQLANHQAFAALALYNIFLITGDPVYRDASDAFRDLTLSWQHPEGWFQEYEGADPGYHSCSIAFLAKLWQKSKDEKLIEPLGRAIEFAQYFMHPDGSYAGEYGSRNTYHFYPHGFEVMAPLFPAAGRIADTYLRRALPERRRYFNDDNRMLAHYVYDWMQSWLDWREPRQGTLDEHRGPFERWFPGARLFVKKTDRYYAVLSLAKGGVLKVFDESGPLFSDTGLFLETDEGHVLATNFVDTEFAIEADPSSGRFASEGRMHRWKRHLSDPAKQILFRGMNLTVGRFPASANLVRASLQKVLITGKRRSDVKFRREIEMTEDDVVVRDQIDAGEAKGRFTRLAVGPDATSIYVANSNTFQESVLLPWIDLGAEVERLNADRRVDLPPRALSD